MKSVRLLSVVIILGFVIFAVQPAIAAKSMTLKIGHGHSAQHPDHLGLILFKEKVETATKGRIKVQVMPSCQLGTEAEMCEQTKIGAITGLIAARFEDMSPKLYATSLPFLFRDYDHAEKALKGPIGQKYAAYTQDHDMKMLAWTHSGFRQITNNKRPIHKPGDLKGLKMRTPPLENIVKTMEALGASPTPIPFPEVYTSLKTGVVDGQENPYVNIFTGKFFEVQKYLSEVNYIYIASPFVVGLEWWNNLTEADRKIVQNAASVAADRINALVRSEDLKAKKEMAAYGVKINVLSPGERQSFIDMVGPVYDYFIGKGYISRELIKEIQAVK
jgi:tripartite ATP-independent transporter DctP family solute receptor